MGWRDMRKHYEPGAYERHGHLTSPEETREGAGDDWEDPAPLPDGLPPVEAFDPALLPSPLRAWVLDVAERMQAPPDYCAAGAIVVAAALVGRKLGIRPRKYDDWLVVPNLWGAAVGPPSSMKTPALAESKKPLDRLVTKAQEAHEKVLAEHKTEAAVIEAIKKGLNEQIKKEGRQASQEGADRSELDKLATKPSVPWTPKGSERSPKKTGTFHHLGSLTRHRRCLTPGATNSKA